MYIEVRVTDGALTDQAKLFIEVECVNDRGVFLSQDEYAGTVAGRIKITESVLKIGTGANKLKIS